MNPVLAQILETETVTTVDGDSIPLHSQIPRDEGEFLQRLVRECGAQKTLEVGLAFGISALYICDALEKNAATEHHTIDPFQNNQYWQNIGLKNIERAGFADIHTHHNLLSHQAFPQIELQGHQFDFIFIDGAHNFDYVMVDFFCADRVLKDGGLLVLDDCTYDGIRKVCRYIVTNRDYSVHAALPLTSEPPNEDVGIWRRVANIMKRYPGGRKRLKQELLQTDTELGLLPYSRCIAFRKHGDDTRHWTHHEPF